MELPCRSDWIGLPAFFNTRMRFGRKRVAATHVPDVRSGATLGPVPDDSNIPLLDVLGHGFEMLRAIDLGHSLWRVEVASDLAPLASGQIVVVAAYSPEDIETSRPLMQRFMTIVLAMGLGPRYGSRALALGAVGYLDAGNGDVDIRGVFGDAVARVGIRRLRVGSL